jgi:alpha-N-arabinofuranosidase
LTGWSAIGDGISIGLDRLHPLSSALPNSMQVTVGQNASGVVGVRNTGWWGMDVSPGQYSASFYVQALNSTYLNSNTTFTVSLRSNTTGEVLATSLIGEQTTEVDTFRYQQLNVSFYCNASAPDSNNTFEITFDGDQAQGQTFYFSLFSLFPETFKGECRG